MVFEFIDFQACISNNSSHGGGIYFTEGNEGNKGQTEMRDP